MQLQLFQDIDDALNENLNQPRRDTATSRAYNTLMRDDRLTLENLRYTIPQGHAQGVNGIWFMLKMALADKTVWQRLIARFGNDLTLNDFLSGPLAGEDAGISGLWFALFLATFHQRSDVWEYLKRRFGHELTIDDFRTSPFGGRRQGQTGIYLALSHNPKMWEWIEERFINELTHDDIHARSIFDNKTVLELLCLNYSSPIMWSSFCRILLNCESKRLAIDKILDNQNITFRDVPLSIKRLLEFYNTICDLKRKMSSGEVSGEKFQSVATVLTAEADCILDKDNKSEGFYLLAELLFNSENFLSERVQCLLQVKEDSVFAEDAAFEIASIFVTGEFDKDGNPLSELPEEKRQDAKVRALEEGLKYATRGSERFIQLKRRLIGCLLGKEKSLVSGEYSWADDEGDFGILLHNICRRMDASLKLESTSLKGENVGLKRKVVELEDRLRAVERRLDLVPDNAADPHQTTLLALWKNKRAATKINQPDTDDDDASNDTSNDKKKRRYKEPAKRVMDEDSSNQKRGRKDS